MPRTPSIKKSVTRPSARTPEAEALMARKIAALGKLDDAAIRKKWAALFGTPAPKFMRRPLVERFVAHGLQVAAFGGLPRAVLKRFAGIAEAERLGDVSDLTGALVAKPGTRLVRLFNGTIHSVSVEEDGFIWNGERYSSLSAIAGKITGTNWNGWAFFGIKRRSMRNKNAARKAGASPRASSRRKRAAALAEEAQDG